MPRHSNIKFSVVLKCAGISFVSSFNLEASLSAADAEI